MVGRGIGVGGGGDNDGNSPHAKKPAEKPVQTVAMPPVVQPGPSWGLLTSSLSDG